jgi:hypothetical protein
MAEDISGREIAVFVSGHTHAPSLSPLTRRDGTALVVANTGCWLRQLQPVMPWLGAPAVYVPAFVRTHVRVRSDDTGVTVELWDHPSPTDRKLLWIERVTIAGRAPRQPSPDTGPVLVARHTLARRLTPPQPTRRDVD